MEVVLGAGETHTLGAQREGSRQVLLGLGIAPDLDGLVLAGPAEQALKPLVHLLTLGIHLLAGQLGFYGRRYHR
jgi:hypothetical protein